MLSDILRIPAASRTGSPLLEDSCNGKSQDDRLSYEAIIETTTNEIGRSPRPNLAVSGSRSGPLTGSDSDHWPRMSDVGSTAEEPMVCLTLLRTIGPATERLHLGRGMWFPRTG